MAEDYPLCMALTAEQPCPKCCWLAYNKLYMTYLKIYVNSRFESVIQ
jgi:hypothetical protein